MMICIDSFHDYFHIFFLSVCVCVCMYVCVCVCVCVFFMDSKKLQAFSKKPPKAPEFWWWVKSNMVSKSDKPQHMFPVISCDCVMPYKFSHLRASQLSGTAMAIALGNHRVV